VFVVFFLLYHFYNLFANNIWKIYQNSDKNLKDFSFKGFLFMVQYRL